MIYAAILIASIFLLTAFAVERYSRLAGLPSVIVLIAVGMLARPALDSIGLAVKGLEVLVPVVGALGLVLIVLEGALDIELRRDRATTTIVAFAIAAAGLALCAAIFAVAAVAALRLSYFQAAILATPFAVISSAVAIPSSDFLPAHQREFVVYESSASDILGVLVFFALVNSAGSVRGFLAGLVGGGLLSLLLAVGCSAALVVVLLRIGGQVRFIPLLAGLFGLYAGGKLLHLSPLIMVLLFGLMLNNPKIVGRIGLLRRWIDRGYDATLGDFKLLVLELTFAVRGFFFILLGYSTAVSDLASLRAWLAAIVILGILYAVRLILFMPVGRDFARSVVWIAPRGLITVLLFLEAKQVMPLPRYLDGTVVLVVLASAALTSLSRVHLRRQQRGTHV